MITSVCAMAASSATLTLLNNPTICSLCIDSAECSTCQETLFHSLGSAMPTTIRILHVSSLCGLSSPPVSPCYHTECERFTTTGAQRGKCVWLLPSLYYITGICLCLQYLYCTIRLVTIQCVLLTNYSCSFTLIICSAVCYVGLQ